jgi:hypothetical protein
MNFRLEIISLTRYRIISSLSMTILLSNGIMLNYRLKYIFYRLFIVSEIL